MESLEKNQHVPSEVLHNSMQYKFYVPAEECPGIESFVKTDITVIIDSAVKIHGELASVKSWAQKIKGEIVGIWKEISVKVEHISSDESGFIAFPDKKGVVNNTIVVEYGRK